MRLIIGANGLLGRRLGISFNNTKDAWIGTFNKRQEHGLLPLNITNPQDVEGFFLKIRPSTIFLCANLAGGVDFCEKNPDKGKYFYLEGTKLIGSNAQKTGATLIFISTDYIFDGTKGPYKEDDHPNPLNVYGRLKLEAEEWIRKNLKKYIIVRTTNVYGWDPQTVTPNYMMQLYRCLKQGNPFSAASFLWGNPTYAPDLAQAIAELVRKNANGTFHIVGKSLSNRYEWALKACKAFRLDASLISEIKEPSLNMVPRPLKSNLNTDKFRKMFSTVLHNLDQGLELMRNEILQ